MHLRVVSEVPAGRWTTVQFLSKDKCSSLVPPPSKGEFSGSVGSLLADRAAEILHVGLGAEAEVDSAAVRSAAGCAALALRKRAQLRVVLDLRALPSFVEAAVEGLVLGDYRFETFLPKKTPALSALVVLVKKDALAAAKKASKTGQVMAEAANAARQIANLPGNLLYPETLATEAKAIAKRTGLKCKILDVKALQAGKFGGILAVGQGSARGPRLISLEHAGGKKGEPPLVLVGKAITFDTGGVSIKPAAGMEDMIFDKCGGTAVLGAMEAIAVLGLKKNVVGILAAAENMPGANAYRPGDIITMRSGTTVEIVNTDAEGRMVLGDALHWAREHYKAGKIIDLATLTGACGVALGESTAGVWTNNEAFQAEVLCSAKTAGERVWPMPLHPEHAEKIRSQVARIKNSGGRLGGACTAAAFLRVFVGETPWVHVDIAYTAHQKKEARGLAT
ncbi:MAG: leucyl aminopeptidase, partial [Verrucomicrobia bacterium]